MFHQAETELDAPSCLWLGTSATFFNVFQAQFVGDYFFYLK